MGGWQLTGGPMDQAVLVSIILAALTGLTILAYRHPEAFIKLFWPLIIIMNIALACVFAWDMGMSFGYRLVREYINQGSLNEASQVVDANKVFTGRLLLWYLGVAVYLTFLSVLHLLIDKKQPDRKADDKAP